MKRLLLGMLILLCITACDQSAADSGKAHAAESASGTGQAPALDLPPDKLSAAEESEVDAMVLPIPPAWVGDLDGMRERRIVRILVPYSKTFYQVDRGHQRGISYEYGKAFQDWLNKHRPLKGKAKRWRVMFIPTARDELLPKLVSGIGDIAAGALTVTKGRLRIVDFSDPITTNVKEALVTAPGVAKLTGLEELSGQEVHVRPSSSYFEHLVELNQRFKEQGLAPVKIMPANEDLETEDLLQMVNAGMYNMTVADSYIAELWQPLFNDMQIQQDFYLHEGGKLGWALRKNSPELKQAIDAFTRETKLGTTFGNIMRKRYFSNADRLRDAKSKKDMQRFNALIGLFERNAKTYDFDYLMLMAQGFQESQLRQSVRSHAGAVGVMQVMPATAAEMGITDVAKNVDHNIEAGSKYLRMISDRYLSDPEITPVNRTLMSFAAYNAGPANLMKFRRFAEKSGLDPNVWFDNVEQGAARIIGRETVDYVGNIYKYYIVYKLAAQQLEEHDKASQKQN